MRSHLKLLPAFSVMALLALADPASAQAADSAPSPDARLFAVEVRTGPNWDNGKSPGDQAYFKEHAAHLKRLRDAGHILIGARYSDKGLLVFSSKSAADVSALMAQDPSMAAGTFKYEVFDFNVFYSGAVQAPPRR